MTTSPTGSTSSTAIADDRAPLRLRVDHKARTGPVDGAWWPQSRDLVTEAIDLVDHFPDDIGRVARLVYSRPDWDEDSAARRMVTGRGTVKLGAFPHDDTHVMVVTLTSRERLVLVVVPPETEPDRAADVLDAAADASNTDDARTLLGLS